MVNTNLLRRDIIVTKEAKKKKCFGQNSVSVCASSCVTTKQQAWKLLPPPFALQSPEPPAASVTFLLLIVSIMDAGAWYWDQ